MAGRAAPIPVPEFPAMRLAPPLLMVLAATFAAMLADCSSGKEANAPDSAAVAQQLRDSVLKADAAQADSLTAAARADLATLLKDAKSAAFDSIKVVQPPEASGRWPAMAVCGRMSGKGLPAPTAFIYQSHNTLFVQDAKNREAFDELQLKLCAVPPGQVITP